MIEQIKKNKIFSIRNELMDAKNAYYNSKPIMTDSQFDILEKTLKSLDPENDYFKLVGSSIPKVTKWEKKYHKIPMTSLNKVNTEAEFKNWCNEVNSDSFILIPKFDGISINLDYEEGKLVDAISRGNGEIGESILPNVSKMTGVPKEIPFKGNANIRGEIILRTENFEKMNKILIENGEKPYSNKRNAASGISKRYDGSQSEFLEVISYDLIIKGKEFDTEFSKLQEIKDLGFNVLESNYEGLVDSLISNFKEWENTKREKFDVDIDGMCVYVNNLKHQKELGDLNGNPKGKIAWKFNQKEISSKLLNVIWQNGNNRRITPVGIFEEVNLCGANITNASLHNLDIFKNHALRKGDVVLVSRRNDVIPSIESVLVQGKDEEFKEPKNCPSCNTETEIEGTYLICPNDNCPALAIGNIMKWIESLEIMDISEKTIEKLYNAKKIEDASDLYDLKSEDFLELEGLGEKSFNKFHEQLMNKKEIDLNIFIKGLNIGNFGSRLSIKLMKSGFYSLEKMLELNLETFKNGEIEGIKEKFGSKIIEGLKNKRKLIEKLLQKGVIIKKREHMLTEQITQISGLTFTFTGGIERINPESGKHYKREELKKIVENFGGINSETPKKGSFLVQSNPISQSSKSKKSLDVGAKILSESDFFKMVGM